MVRVAFGITCKNASLTIGQVLKLLIMQKCDFEKIFVIVDGGSSDSTLEIVQEILSNFNTHFIIESGEYTIPQGRNRVLELAMKVDADYILFVDADVVFRFRNLVQVLLDLAKKIDDKVAISLRYEHLHFRSPIEASNFIHKILNKNEYLEEYEVKLRAVPWAPLGLLLLPVKAACTRFDEDMTFAEDRKLGFELYKRGFNLFEVFIESSEVAFDINVKSSNIYFSMDLKNYLKGIRKKVAMCVYENFDPFLLRFLKKFTRRNIKCLYHMLYTTLAILGILMNSVPLLFSSFLLIIFYLILQLRKSRNPQNILTSWVKFYIYSFILILLLMPYYLKHRSEFHKIYKKIIAMNTEAPLRSEKIILNLGCGNEEYGNVRADIARTKATNLICDADSTLPFKEEAFDEVYSKCLFEHLKNPNFFLQEVRRVLKKGGKVTIITDNASYLRFHISKNLPFPLKIGWRHGGEYPSTNPLDRHYALYQPEHIKNHFEACGLKIVELKLISYKGDETPSKKLDKLINILLGKNFAFPRIKVVAFKQ